MHRYARLNLLALFIMYTFALPYLCFSNIGAEWNPTGNPIGGGPGYGDCVNHQFADYFVSSKNELLNAFSNADFGDLIYVADSASIDLSGSSSICVPSGVILASGRGRVLGDTVSWGALIYVESPGLITGGNSVFVCGGTGKQRITGLRLRGSFSELEGGRDNDTFPTWTNESCIVTTADSVEVDNCEFWGFSCRAVDVAGGQGTYIHHNYMHDCAHAGFGGGFCSSNGGKFIGEANLIDKCRSAFQGGNNPLARFEARYNLLLEHAYQHDLDRHGTGVNPQSAAADYVHHNTVRWNSYVSGDVNGFRCRGYPVDSVLVHNNWFLSEDSTQSIMLYQNSDSMCRVWNNQYGSSAPNGVSGRIPHAVANASLDSGSVPLFVTFSAEGSYDVDGNICAYYWDFGDNNKARCASNNGEVAHTFDEIGMYRVELMITDDDGCVAKDWVDVMVAPPNDSSYLSVWVKDRHHDAMVGCYSKQILIDNNIVWEDDVAGDEGWQHIVQNVTSLLYGKDSVTLTLRLLCEQDNPQFSNFYVVWDDIMFFGAEVRNGNFENCAPHATNLVDWTFDKNWTYYRGYPFACEVRSGNRSHHLEIAYDNVNSAGNWCEIKQRFAVGAAGIPGSGTNFDFAPCSVYFPYPNPAKIRTLLSYKLDLQNAITFDIYDAGGRFIRNLLEGMQTPGEYHVSWDGRDRLGNDVPNGVYFFRIVAGDYEENRQIVWLR